jgi:hypothetical protein
MNWNFELAYFITPKAGPMRAMQTLLDANRAMLDTRQHSTRFSAPTEKHCPTTDACCSIDIDS